MRRKTAGDSRDPSWDSATWDGNEHAQLREVVLRSTPAERLRWLEEALRLAHRSGALERLRRERALGR